MTQFIGVDPSLTATGLALWPGITATIKGRGKGFPREDELVGAVVEWIQGKGQGAPLVIAIEGGSLASGGRHSRGHLALIGYRWRLLRALCHLGAVLEVPPSTLKKWGTGNGRADKAEMIRGAEVLCPDFNGGHDEADALHLASVAAAWATGKIERTPINSQHHTYKCSVIDKLTQHMDSLPLSAVGH